MSEDPPDSATMQLVKLSEPSRQAGAPKSRNFDSYRISEAVLRQAVEDWGRARWPMARVCHELVMDRGAVRLDIAFISPDRLAVVEIKSGFDNTERLIHQVAVARLASDEVWSIADSRHAEDIRLVNYLLPTTGAMIAKVPAGVAPTSVQLEVMAEPIGAFAPDPEVQLTVLWVAELRQVAAWAKIGVGPATPHAALVKSLRLLDPDQRRALVCRALRARSALWRADQPIILPDE